MEISLQGPLHSRTENWLSKKKSCLVFTVWWGGFQERNGPKWKYAGWITRVNLAVIGLNLPLPSHVLVQKGKRISKQSKATILLCQATETGQIEKIKSESSHFPSFPICFCYSHWIKAISLLLHADKKAGTRQSEGKTHSKWSQGVKSVPLSWKQGMVLGCKNSVSLG